jgi:hypothetical protein
MAITLKRRKTFNKSAGILSELRTGKRLKANLVPASGAVEGLKGDLYIPGDPDKPTQMVECKSTVKDSLSLKLSWLYKVVREARDVGMRPVMSLSFTTEDGRPRRGGTWICLPEADYQELMDDSEELGRIKREIPKDS